MELNKYVSLVPCPVCESNSRALFYLDRNTLEVLSEDLMEEFVSLGIAPDEEISLCLVCETFFTLGGFDDTSET